MSLILKKYKIMKKKKKWSWLKKLLKKWGEIKMEKEKEKREKDLQAMFDRWDKQVKEAKKR